MIVIAGTVRVRSERRDEAIGAMLEMADATRGEPGCLSYRFSADLTDRSTFFLFEEWESEDALARHFRTAHMEAFRRRIPDLAAGPSAIRRYEVASVAPM